MDSSTAHACAGHISVSPSAPPAEYNTGSGSKANRLRGFWSVEANYTVGKLLNDLMACAAEIGIRPEDQNLIEASRRTVDRLLQSTSVTEIHAINPNSEERDFEQLAKSIREAIEKNQPESGLDRLHTFTVKYFRVLCERYGIAVPTDKPLHSLIGEYVKGLKVGGHIDSDMTERILKSSISVLEAFSRVRNDHSFAHDNRILNYEESLLIFNHVASLIRFIDSLERKIIVRTHNVEAPFNDDDIPF